jgi:hypothetical protein
VIGRKREVYAAQRSPHMWLLPERPRREHDEGSGPRQPIRAWLPGERLAANSDSA